MFAVIVQRYNYIALLILSTFLLKLMVVDTQWIITTLTGQEIHINPFCVNKNQKDDAHDPVFTLDADHTATGSLSGICTVQIILEHDTQKTSASPIHDQIIYRNLDQDEVFQDQNYPPPQSSFLVA